MRDPNDFEKFCRKYFQYLEDCYQFQFRSFDWYHVEYRSSTTLIDINYDHPLSDVLVKVCRLIGGEVAEKSTNIQSNAQFNCHDLIDIADLRAPSWKTQLGGIPDLPMGQLSVELQVEIYSKLLRKHAHDLLEGDFSIFSKLDRIISQRIGGEDAECGNEGCC